MIYYFALLATLLACSANPLAQARRGRTTSTSVVGRTSEICEPVYEEHLYHEYDDDFRNYRQRNRDKQFQDPYDYSDELSDDIYRDMGLEKHFSINTNTNNDKYKKIHRKIKKIGKSVRDQRDSARTSTTNNGHSSSNSNVNEFGKGKHKMIVKSSLNGDEVDAEDISDSEESVELSSRILENGRSKHDPPPYVGNRIAEVSNRGNFGNDRSKHDPPPYFGNRIAEVSNRGGFGNDRSKHDPPPYFGNRIAEVSNRGGFGNDRSKHDPPPYFGNRIAEVSNRGGFGNDRSKHDPPPYFGNRIAEVSNRGGFGNDRSKHDPPPYFGNRIADVSNRGGFGNDRSKHDPPPYFGNRIADVSNRGGFGSDRSKHDPPPYFGNRIAEVSNRNRFGDGRSKHDPPPFFGNRIAAVSDSGISGNDEIVNDEKKNEKEVLSQINNETEQSDFSVNQAADEQTQDTSKTSITGEPIEIIAPNASSVNGAVEVSSSPVNTDNKPKKSLKIRKGGVKSHRSKKEKRNRHKKQHLKSENPEQQVNNLEKNFETTTSIIESGQKSFKSLQSFITGKVAGKVLAKKKPHRTDGTLKLSTHGGHSSSLKVRKPKKFIGKFGDNMKGKISEDLKKKPNVNKVRGKQLGGKTGVGHGGAKTKVTIDSKFSGKIGTSSDGYPTNNETKNPSKSLNEMEKNIDVGMNAETPKNVEKNAFGRVTINAEATAKQSGPNNVHFDENNEASDYQNAAKIKSILRDSKLNGDSKESSKKMESVDVDEARNSEDAETAKNVGINASGRVTINEEATEKESGPNNVNFDENNKGSDHQINAKIESNLGNSKLNGAPNESSEKREPVDVDGAPNSEDVETTENATGHDRDDESPGLVNNEPVGAGTGKLSINVDGKSQNNDIQEKTLMPSDEGGEIDYRKTNHARRSNKNSNANTNVNTNVNELSPHLRRFSHTPGTARRSAKSDHNRKKLAQKERESDDDNGVDYRGIPWHQRHNDMLYAI